MFDNIINFFKKFSKETKKESKDMAKERLHLVLMQDRANVSADFLEMMKQEIIEVIKKYIDVDENSIDVKLTNKVNADGTTGAPALYANIPIVSMKDETKKININRKKDNEVTNKEDKETKLEVSEKVNNEDETKVEDIGKEEQEQSEQEENVDSEILENNEINETSKGEEENEIEEVTENVENNESEEPKNEEIEKTEVK